MKILKAAKDMYFEGRMVLIGKLYETEDHIAARHIRAGKAVEYVPMPVSKAENRQTKVGRPKKNKEGPK